MTSTAAPPPEQAVTRQVASSPRAARRSRVTGSARRRTNQALLVLVPAAVLTGLYANTIGVDGLVDPATVHGVVALAIALLTPWKQAVVRSGLRRRRSSRWASIGLVVLIATALGSGLAHATGRVSRLGPLTTMQVHVGAALLALVLVVLHVRAHPVRIRRTDLGRRAFLSTTALAAAGTGAWFAWERVLRLGGLPGAERRFTGSHERGSFDPDRMPVTSWLDDRVQHIEVADWSLAVDGASLTLAQVEAAGLEDVTAVLDCTGGWYAEQVWTGVRLDRLVETDRRAVDVRSATGYGRRFPTRDLDRLWLVTRVGGAPLSAGHGFPARIVAPDRRGFWWVKWVTSIETTDRPWWAQLPFPAT